MLQSRLKNTKNILESNDQTALASITREDLLGDMMYAGTLSYFAQLQAQYELSALSSKAKTGLLAGKGIFGYEPKIDYLFGLPRSISSGGIHLDIETTRVVRALDNDQQKTIDFAIQTGSIGSALEHQVPEQMFNTDPANPTQGISTVKALQLANQQGQKIYKIDQTNIDTVLPKLNLSSTIKQDIQSSVNAGKYVITHTDNVSVPGWSGAGYAIIDPLTGSDAYMISGGENGGFLQFTTWLFAALYLNFRVIDAFAASNTTTGVLGSMARLLVVPMFFLSLTQIGLTCPVEVQSEVIGLLTVLTVTHLTALLILAIAMGPMALLAIALLNQFLLKNLMAIEYRRFGCI